MKVIDVPFLGYTYKSVIMSLRRYFESNYKGYDYIDWFYINKDLQVKYDKKVVWLKFRFEPLKEILISSFETNCNYIYYEYDITIQQYSQVTNSQGLPGPKCIDFDHFTPELSKHIHNMFCLIKDPIAKKAILANAKNYTVYA